MHTPSVNETILRMCSFLNTTIPPIPSDGYTLHSENSEGSLSRAQKCHLVVPFKDDHFEERFATSSLHFATSRQT